MDSFLEALPKVAGDLSLVLLFLAVAVGFGFFFGRTKLLSLMIDVYIARALVAVIPHDWIALVAYSDVIIFTLVFVFLLLTDHRLFDIHLSNRGSDFFWRLGVMSILVTGMAVSSFLSYLPKDVVLGFISKSMYSYFVSIWATLLWMFLPLLTLFFINRRLRD